MDVKNCKSCKRLFNYISGPQICPACASQLEEKFQKVKEYIREVPHATMEAIADENEVSVKQIKQWVREERLTFSDDSPVGLECEMCGAMVRTGRFCEKCKGAMKTNLTRGIDEPQMPKQPGKKTDSRSRMRYLD